MRTENTEGEEMKTLHQIQNEAAKEKYNCSFIYATSFLKVLDMRDFMQEVAKRYAAEALRSASEIAEVETVDIDYEKAGYKGRTYNTPAKTYAFTTPGHGGGSNYEVRVYKQSILNIINELK